MVGAGLAGAAAALSSRVGGLGQVASAAEASPYSDADILNFALNLEYLEAEFYLRATTGSGLADADIRGAGTVGEVKGGKKVPFAVPAIKDYADQLANDEQNHVVTLRAALTSLGVEPVARPEININHAFTNAAVAAKIIPEGQKFDAYADDVNFLLGAFVFEDVGVTAYHGAAPFISNSGILSAAAGILAVEAYHSGNIRTSLFQLAEMNMPSIITDANAISALRGKADGSSNGHETPLVDKDGIVHVVAADPTTSIAYARSFAEVLRIVYLGQKASHHGGGFFPMGLNGRIR